MQKTKKSWNREWRKVKISMMGYPRNIRCLNKRVQVKHKLKIYQDPLRSCLGHRDLPGSWSSTHWVLRLPDTPTVNLVSCVPRWVNKRAHPPSIVPAELPGSAASVLFARRRSTGVPRRCQHSHICRHFLCFVWWAQLPKVRSVSSLLPPRIWSVTGVRESGFAYSQRMLVWLRFLLVGRPLVSWPPRFLTCCAFS